ncbi:MAG: YezD family protein [Planctomycetaceae bacterium]|nr:YezD family protein [Planctomycetaceae bacterium]
MMTTNDTPTQTDIDREFQERIRQILDALTGLQYGSVTIVIHDGRVVQIDRTQQRRVIKPARRR